MAARITSQAVCNLADFTANGEWADQQSEFRQVKPDCRYADDVTRGFGARQSLVGFQRIEINISNRRRGIGDRWYYRNWDLNFSVTDNTAVGPEDYDS